MKKLILLVSLFAIVTIAQAQKFRINAEITFLGANNNQVITCDSIYFFVDEIGPLHSIDTTVTVECLMMYPIVNEFGQKSFEVKRIFWIWDDVLFTNTFNDVRIAFREYLKEKFGIENGDFEIIK